MIIDIIKKLSPRKEVSDEENQVSEDVKKIVKQRNIDKFGDFIFVAIILYLVIWLISHLH